MVKLIVGRGGGFLRGEKSVGSHMASRKIEIPQHPASAGDRFRSPLNQCPACLELKKCSGYDSLDAQDAPLHLSETLGILPNEL